MKQFFRQNGILIVIIAVLLAAIIGVCSAIFGMSPLSNVLGVHSTPFRAGVDAVASWVEDRYNYAFRYDELLAENESLRQQVADLQEEIRAAQDANRQNELYRELLNLAERRADFDLEDATVTVRATSNWSSTLTINKGSSVDVAVGDCVVDQYGNLVGVITEVGYNWSTLATVVDPSTEIGGRIPRTDDEAVLEGDFTLMGEGRLKLSYLPENTVPISGDQVTTSGLGDQYPAGLVVGTIESIHTEASGLTRYAVVEPAADLENIKYVFVIKSFDVVQ